MAGTKHRRGRHSPVRLMAWKRRQFVFNLRLSGATENQIAELTIAEFGSDTPKGYDGRYVSKDIQRYIDQTEKPTAEERKKYYYLSLARLERLLLAVWPNAQRGNVGAVDRATNLVVRIIQLTGAAPAEELTVNIRTELSSGLSEAEKADRIWQLVQASMERQQGAEGDDLIHLPAGLVVDSTATPVMENTSATGDDIES